MTTYGLVLSGGGARGAFEAGVLKALEEAKIAPSVISGTSAGAINGTAAATGMTADEIIAVWDELRAEDVYRFRHDVWNALDLLPLLRDPKRLLPGRRSPFANVLEAIGWTWFLDTAPLRATLVERLCGEQVKVADGVVLNVVAVEDATGKLARFTNRRPDGSTDPRYREVDLTVDHVLSSAAIPILFKPVRFPDGLYVDGGIGSNTPLGAALGHDPDVVFVVATGAIDRTSEDATNLSESIGSVVDDLLRISLVKDVEYAERINELIDAVGPGYAGGKYKKIEFHVIAPPPGGAGVDDFLDFQPEKARVLVEQGIAEGRRAVAAHRARQATTPPQTVDVTDQPAPTGTDGAASVPGPSVAGP